MTEMMIEVINSQCANLREHLRTANNRFDLNVWGLFYNIDISRSNIDPPQYRGSCNFLSNNFIIKRGTRSGVESSLERGTLLRRFSRTIRNYDNLFGV